MQDLISRQAAIDEVVAWLKDRMSDKKNGKPLTERLRDLPSAQQDCADCPEYDHKTHSCQKFCDVIRKTMKEAKQERTGRWVRNFDGNEWYWFCSNCKEEWYEEDLLMGGNDFPNFCPNCGAEMSRGE